MFGYACDETEDLMPLPIWLAHRLAHRLSEVRKAGILPYLRPDGKTQVTFDYEDGRPVRLKTVLISTQHAPNLDAETLIKPDLNEHVIHPLLPPQFADDGFDVLVNPTGKFELGGPHADTRPHRSQDHRRHLRRHGPPRWRRVLRARTRRRSTARPRTRRAGSRSTSSPRARRTRCEIQVAYAIGVARPVSIMVETFGTEHGRPGARSAIAVDEVFDLRPAAIIRDLDLRRPIYRRTAAYGHFGRAGEGVHLGAHRPGWTTCAALGLSAC